MIGTSGREVAVARTLGYVGVTGSAELFLARVKTLAKEHGARCVVIDPLSILAKSGNELTAHSVAERLIDWSKAGGAA